MFDGIIMSRMGMLFWVAMISLCFSSELFAVEFTDDFSSGSLSSSWTQVDYTGLGPAAVVANNRLEYVGALSAVNPFPTGAYITKWGGVVSTSGSWEATVDAHLGLTLQRHEIVFIGMTIDWASGSKSLMLDTDIENDSIQNYVIYGFGLYPTQIILPPSTTAVDASFKYTFDASTSLLSGFYKRDTDADWTLVASDTVQQIGDFHLSLDMVSSINSSNVFIPTPPTPTTIQSGQATLDNFHVQSVPEPSSISLVITSVSTFLFLARRKSFRSICTPN